jgi:hypothetical protein
MSSRRLRAGSLAHDSGTIIPYGCTDPSIFDTYPRTTSPVAAVHGAFPSRRDFARSAPSFKSVFAFPISSTLKNSSYASAYRTALR